jgi:hypothetical protein
MARLGLPLRVPVNGIEKRCRMTFRLNHGLKVAAAGVPAHHGSQAADGGLAADGTPSGADVLWTLLVRAGEPLWPLRGPTHDHALEAEATGAM